MCASKLHFLPLSHNFRIDYNRLIPNYLVLRALHFKNIKIIIFLLVFLVKIAFFAALYNQNLKDYV
jgi:hypothetical protein